MESKPPAKPAPLGKLVPNPKARLREQVREVVRFRHLSERTEETYWQWMRRFLVWAKDHPHRTPAFSAFSAPSNSDGRK